MFKKLIQQQSQRGIQPKDIVRIKTGYCAWFRETMHMGSLIDDGTLIEVLEVRGDRILFQEANDPAPISGTIPVEFVERN